MRKIRSKGSRLDMTMKKILQRARLPYTIYPKMFGSPDFLVGVKIVVFCDSAFWHGRDWDTLKAQLEKGNNPNYWVSHIERNMRRDKEVTAALKSSGYAVIRFWETDIYKTPENCVKQLERLIGESISE